MARRKPRSPCPTRFPGIPDIGSTPAGWARALKGRAAALPDGEVAASAESSYLPVSFKSIRVYRDTGRQVRCRAYLANLDGGAGQRGRVALIDDSGPSRAEVDGIYLRRVDRRAVPLPLAQKIFDAEWEQSPLGEVTPVASDTTETEPGSWLVLAAPTPGASAKK